MYPSFAKSLKLQEEEMAVNNKIIDHFVESVNIMNEVVLIPSRLRDICVDSDKQQAANKQSEDLFHYFKMINSVKNDLFVPSYSEDSGVFTPKRKISRHSRESPRRKLSQESVSSVASASSHDSVDSGLNVDRSTQLTEAFVHHLHSIYAILDQFTQAADYITERYQQEMGSAAY